MDASADRIATNIRKGVLEFCVLALLEGREMYGLELANELVGRSLTASEGSLYPLLTRMRDAGSVETRWVSEAGTRNRRYYAITAAGSEQLARFRIVWAEISPEVHALMKEER